MRLAIHRGGKVAVSSRPLGRYPQIDFQSRDDKLEALWCASRKILELLGDRRSATGLDNPVPDSSNQLVGLLESDTGLNEAANAGIRVLVGAEEKPA